MQNTLPFLNNLLADWYQLTLDNALYAISLAVSVWLLTAIFYSLRIGFLNRRNRLNTHAAQQQIQQLQEQIAANKALLDQAKAATEQEAQRAAALQERISGLGKQLSEGIQTLAANADLAEQSLPAADTFETEGLCQRYRQSVMQLIERLRTEQQTTTELQQAHRAEIAKLAEKDLELSTLQTRLDSQTQQFAQFELIIEEHKNQLRQQENAEQRLSETLQKHQADLARLAALEQQALAWANSQQQPAHQEQPLKPQEIPIAQQEQTPPVETAPIQPEPALAEVKPQPAQIEIEPVGFTKPAAQETALIAPPVKALKEPPAQATGKLKDLFASTMRQVKKLDEKLTGRSNSTPAPEQLGQPDELNVEPRAVTAETHSHDSQSGALDQRQPIHAAKEQDSGTAGKLKNLFARSKRASSAMPAMVEKSTQSTPPETTPPSEQSSGDQAATTSGANKKMPVQLKNLFSKFKR